MEPSAGFGPATITLPRIFPLQRNNSIYEDDESFNRFYNEPHTFLCLVGVKIDQEGTRKFSETIVKGKFPQIALIPGRELIAYLKAEGTKSISASLIPLINNKHKLSTYFGESNIERCLEEDLFEQEKKDLIDKSKDKKHKNLNMIKFHGNQ